MALERDEDRNFLECAKLLWSEHFHRSLKLIKDLSQLLKTDIDKGPDVRDAKVSEAENGVDMVFDELWAAHAPCAV